METVLSPIRLVFI